MSRSDLDSRTDIVIVTGASRGIGLAVCRRFVQRGARVGMIARDEVQLRKASQHLGSRACFAAADVSRPDELGRAMAQLEAALGPPSVLVNNAGHGHWGAVVDTDLEVFRNIIDVNYLGAVSATGLVLAGMLHRGRGHIVNVASIAGRIGAPFEAAYSASKFALIGYTEALAIELAGSGVAVSLVTPGPVRTDFAANRGSARRHALPRPIEADRVAECVVAAVDGRRSEQFRPRWLRLAFMARVDLPVVHRVGTRWMFSGQRRAMRDAHREIDSTATPD